MRLFLGFFLFISSCLWASQGILTEVPKEIIEKIIDKLHKSDRKNISLVSKGLQESVISSEKHRDNEKYINYIARETILKKPLKESFFLYKSLPGISWKELVNDRVDNNIFFINNFPFVLPIQLPIISDSKKWHLIQEKNNNNELLFWLFENEKSTMVDAKKIIVFTTKHNNIINSVNSVYNDTPGLPGSFLKRITS